MIQIAAPETGIRLGGSQNPAAGISQRTPCGYEPEEMGEKCKKCKQWACTVYADAPAPNYTPKPRKK